MSPKPFPAETNAEEQGEGARLICIQFLATSTQSMVEHVLDIALPTAPNKVSVHENCHKISQTPSAPRARKGRKMFFVMSAMRLTSRMISPRNEIVAGPELYSICPTACDHACR